MSASRAGEPRAERLIRLMVRAAAEDHDEAALALLEECWPGIDWEAEVEEYRAAAGETEEVA